MSFRVGPLSPNPFDSFSDYDSPIRPFWTISDLEDSQQVEKWFSTAIPALERYYQSYFQIQLDNILIARGVQWLAQERTAGRLWEGLALNNRRNPRVVINQTYDAIEYWVSKLTRFRPAVAINPANAESKDAEDAKIAKDVLDYIWYINNIDRKNAELVRLAKTTGEAFRFIDYDPEAGDLHPDYVKLSNQGQRVPLLGPNGEPILGVDGQPLYIQGAVRVGEVRHRVVPGYHVFEEICSDRAQINWAITWEAIDADELKAQYPEFADKIKATGVQDVFAAYGPSVPIRNNQVVLYTLYHRHHPRLSKGRLVKRISNCILENVELPYSHGKLPYVYLGDIDVPGQTRSMSFIQQTFPIQHQINACASLIYKAFVLLAHPKIVTRENSCDLTQLVNESTIIEYSEEPPSILQTGVFPQELFPYLQQLIEFFNRLSGQYTLSTGQAPSGVRAAKALRVIEEQEDKRAYFMAVKYNDVALVEDAKMSLSVAGDFYDDSDGRLARVVGAQNEYRLRSFQVANLAKPYDIRIETTTALSQSPAARIQELIELANIRLDPTSPISREQFIKLLDLGALEEFKDITTRAYVTAKAENEQMRSSTKVPDPTEVEDLIVHWRTHVQDMQGMDFKAMLPEQARKLFEQHLLITEFLMFKKAFGVTDNLGNVLAQPNPIFQQKVMTECQQWPLLFSLPTPSPSLSSGIPPPLAGFGAKPSSVLQPAPIDAGAPLPNRASVAPPPPSVVPEPLT